LVTIGGLTSVPSIGVAAVALDLHEANEVYELRLMLEPVALERSNRGADDAYRERVATAWQALRGERVAPASDHAAFHRALISACDSEWLRRMATMMADRAGLMISLSAQSIPEGYDTAERHGVLKDLALSGDAEGAAAELRRHLSGSIGRLEAIHDERARWT